MLPCNIPYMHRNTYQYFPRVYAYSWVPVSSTKPPCERHDHRNAWHVTETAVLTPYTIKKCSFRATNDDIHPHATPGGATAPYNPAHAPPSCSTPNMQKCCGLYTVQAQIDTQWLKPFLAVVQALGNKEQSPPPAPLQKISSVRRLS